MKRCVPCTRPPCTRPNILLIMTDQQSASAMSCAGNPHLHTPTIDALAAGGMRFERAYSGNPICVPCRASLFTGLMSHQTGIEHNDHRQMADVPCLGRRLRDVGYDSGYVGKWHVPRTIQDQGWSGFNFLAQIRNVGIDAAVAPSCDQFLSQPRDGPFFLVASFVNPHDICHFARIEAGLADRLPGGDIGTPPPLERCPPLPDNFEPPADEPEAIRIHQRLPRQAKVYPTAGWGEAQWRRYRWAYFRLTEAVDREIARVLAALRGRGLERDTVVIFLSDHGDGMGAHRWNQKTLFYEESARVPFVLHQPGVIPRGIADRSALVNIGIDLATTCLGIAGAEVPAALHGCNLYDYARGTTGQTHRFIVSQNHLFEAPDGRPMRGRMLRSDRFKYIVFDYGARPEQLFDLDQDPGEMNSLAGRPEEARVLAAHRQMLRGWLEQHGDPFVMPAS